jgi:diacylglycerol kinase family enzyme
MVFVNSVAAGVLAAGPGWFPWWPRPLLPARRITIASGDTATESVAAGALVVNGQFWGDRVAAPRSTMIDGVLDVQMFNGHRIALSRLRRTMRSGMHVRSHHVRRRALGEAMIEAPRAWQVAVDGIRVGRGGFRVSCLPGAVRLAI